MKRIAGLHDVVVLDIRSMLIRYIMFYGRSLFYGVFLLCISSFFFSLLNLQQGSLVCLFPGFVPQVL